MAQISYRGNLSSATFPLISQNFGRSVIVKAYDNTYQPSIASKEDADKDTGIPQVYYCHNVLPNAQGFNSIGYVQDIASVSGSEVLMQTVFSLRSSAEELAYFCHTSDGRNFIFTQTIGAWLQINTLAGILDEQVTVAHVAGVSYIYFATQGCYQYNFVTQLLEPVTLTGLTAAAILGLTSASGYLIAWSSTEIAWCSTVDVTDFVPSLTTGAGGGAVEGAAGALRFCAAVTNGFIVYTANNAVSSTYSGNARYPFNFKPLAGSGGFEAQELVAYDASTAAQYAYTASGLQTLSLQQATTVFPDITDFISGAYFEDFDETTRAFTYTKLTTTMVKKLSVISDRYVVFSYGITELTHAIVFDTALKRYGKLKLAHSDCFEATITLSTIQDLPKNSISFMQKDGRVVHVVPFYGSSISSGVLIIGKFQYIRQRNLCMEEINLENVDTSATFALYDFYAMDGKNYSSFTCYLADDDGAYRKYYSHKEALNHSLCFIGSYNLSSLVLTFTLGGRR